MLGLMRIVVSPYHLTTREPAAMAALLLAREVVTLLPAPLDGSGSSSSALAAARRVPTYRAFVESWAWTQPLWQSGLLTSNIEGDSPAHDMFDVGQKIAAEEALGPLRQFTHEEFYDDERRYLGALAADLLKGGPDPGISVPLAAGLDRFGARHGMTIARSAPVSLAQKAEATLATQSSSAVVPILLQASAQRILHAREVLADALENLWDAQPLDGLRIFADTFARRREEVLEDCRNDEIRVVEGAANITLMTLPGDAVLRSSLTALAAMGPRRSHEVRNTENLPARYDHLDQTPIATLVVRPLGLSKR
jgi:hypothetical protein